MTVWKDFGQGELHPKQLPENNRRGTLAISLTAVADMFLVCLRHRFNTQGS